MVRRLLAASVLSLALVAGAGVGTASAHTSTAAKRARAFDLYRTADTKAERRHWLARFRYWRNEDVWSQRYHRGVPAWLKRALARLRGCETRGIPYPANYRYRGHHFGAYQYTLGTWWRAGGRGNPADATPHEQDVRTARFWPSHRGEWACKA